MVFVLLATTERAIFGDWEFPISFPFFFFLFFDFFF